MKYITISRRNSDSKIQIVSKLKEATKKEYKNRNDMKTLFCNPFKKPKFYKDNHVSEPFLKIDAFQDEILEYND